MAKRPSLKTLASIKIDDLEQYALQSPVAKRILASLYQSELYTFFSKKINNFRDYKLIEEIKQHPVPRHVAIIMDGNRRFAQLFELKPKAGHVFGRRRVEDVLDWCFDLGIRVLTIYAFSLENFQRTDEEVKTLMRLCSEELNRACSDSRIHKNKVRVKIFGHLESLPDETRQYAKKIMQATKSYDQYFFNIALAYGGREEIVQAIKRIADSVKRGEMHVQEISEKTVSSYLYTNGIPDPDLILRTSGEERISNFLLWQLAYSELYFSDVYWPAFQKRDFLNAIQTYQKRKRRYGR